MAESPLRSTANGRRHALGSVSTNSPSRTGKASTSGALPTKLTATTKRKHASPSKKRELDAALALALNSIDIKRESKSRSASPTKQQQQHHASSSSNLLATASSSRSLLTAGGLMGKQDIAIDDIDLTGPIDTRKTPSKHRSKSTDRFIPSRPASASGDHTGPIMLHDTTGNLTAEIPKDEHTSELSATLGIDSSKRILSFSAEPPPTRTEHSALLASYARLPSKGSAASSSSSNAAASRRRIATAPERVLDAPGLIDDYYLNLLDWSCTNLVAIALGESVYVWNAETGDVNALCSVGNEHEDEYVASIKFAEDGSFLAVGLSSGPIQVYDVETGTLIRTMSGHLSRVPSLSWSGAILSSGSRTGEIWNSDARIAQHCVAQLKNHRGEVCGLEWRPEIAGGLSGGGQGLLASGGNDNIVNVWDGRMTSAPKMTKTNHTAAVKALAWSPWMSSLLATGGGTSDKTIHFWNTTTGARLNSLVTPSQVTSLVFSSHSRELLSSHGIPDHQLTVWSYPSLSKVCDIPQAHETRILHSCLSPDGTTVATASSDENLKFWKVFEARKAGAGGPGSAMMTAKQIDEDHGIGRKSKTGIRVR